MKFRLFVKYVIDSSISWKKNCGFQYQTRNFYIPKKSFSTIFVSVDYIYYRIFRIYRALKISCLIFKFNHNLSEFISYA